MQLSDFSYVLPPELIAQTPPATRSGGRMLVVAAGEEGFRDAQVVDLPGELRAGDLLVLNDTRVIRARLHGVKESGGRIEAMIERVLDTQRALAQVRASKTPKPGGRLLFGVDGALEATVIAKHDDLYELVFDTDDLLAALDAHGELPLPPYITRKAGDDDDARYQTVWAREPGAVAAPTASLHFDDAMLAAIRGRGVEIAFATLHVGAGTFQPVRVDDLSQHRMHAERVTVSAALAAAVAAAKARGGRVVAAGTTVVRALETAAAENRRGPAVSGRNPAVHHARLRLALCRCAADQLPPAGKHFADAGLRVRRLRAGDRGVPARCRAALPVLQLWRRDVVAGTQPIHGALSG